MSAISSAGGAPLPTQPAPPAAARAHAQVSLEAGAVERPLFCDHGDGDISIRVTAGDVHVWLNGTADELHAFASLLHRLTNDAGRELVKAPHEDAPLPPTVLPKVDEDAA